MPDVGAPAFWEEMYTRGGDGWELGRPAPPLVEVIESTPPPRGRVAVPGCGRGHDGRFLARHGYQVTGFDFAPTAVMAARTLARIEGVEVTIDERDVLDLPAEHAHAFDGVWEYTCFCAIDPCRRDDYVRAMARIVKPGGWFLACFFPLHSASAGPPFPVSREEIHRRLAPSFRIEREFAPVRSARGRQGREWVVLAYNVC